MVCGKNEAKETVVNLAVYANLNFMLKCKSFWIFIPRIAFKSVVGSNKSTVTK